MSAMWAFCGDDNTSADLHSARTDTSFYLVLQIALEESCLIENAYACVGLKGCSDVTIR